MIKGAISLMGPRPYLPVERESAGAQLDAVPRARPGMTGLWQVSGKSHLPFEQMVMLDLRYINEWSIWLDLKILLETIPLVFIS